MPDELEQAIKDNAAGLRRAKGDSGEVEQHDLKDHIKADRNLNAKAAAKRRGSGSGRMAKAVPPDRHDPCRRFGNARIQAARSPLHRSHRSRSKCQMRHALHAR
ncbi:MAG TPA: hypothetical protein ENJ35_00175 [Gammaproteobacteria bacterium]|nr:hypothetical protein [Gammaproteobacteria bacterium]